MPINQSLIFLNLDINMIVDNYNDDSIKGNTRHSLPKNNLLNKIIKSIKLTHTHFINVLINKERSDFNEDELTQFFIIQNYKQISNLNIPVYASVQYRDTYFKTKGIPDIYYVRLEEGIDFRPIFIMEAKRLPTPTKKREKEYVIGKTGKPNGGIERFKLEKHGKGLIECGLLAYIEKDSFNDWLQKINNWILEQKPEWSSKELLNLESINDNLAYLKSITIRENDNLNLHHFWIDISETVNK